MFLRLYDRINDREEDYEVSVQSYRGMWGTIDEIIRRHHYSCVGYIVPEINREKHLVTIRWSETATNVAGSYIEVLECEDYLLDVFERNIRHHEERRRNRDEFEEHA